MSPDPTFAALMDRLRRGDQDAARRIFQRFAGRLIALARQHLDARIRQKVDAEDVLQSVWKSFFRRHAEGQFDLDNWDSLWSLLTVITLCKCGYQTRHFRTASRDVQREKAQAAEDDSSASWEAIAREPTPAEAAMLTETVEQLTRALDERDRQILELSLQGETVGQVSTQLRISERTVERVLERVRKRLERLRSQE
jgi:RNA polymerase sigma-70 factor (ECF subfamily)